MKEFVLFIWLIQAIGAGPFGTTTIGAASPVGRYADLRQCVESAELASNGWKLGSGRLGGTQTYILTACVPIKRWDAQ